MKLKDIAKVKKGEGFEASLKKLDNQIKIIEKGFRNGDISRSEANKVRRAYGKYKGTQIVGFGLEAQQRAEKALKKVTA